MKELSVIFAKVAFIGIDFFDGVFGVATGGDTEGKIGAVVMRSRSHFRGEDEAVVGIDRGVLFKSEVGDIIFDCPVRFDIPGEFKGIPVFIQFSRRCFSFLFFFFQLFLAYGMAGRFDQTCVNGYAFVDG